MAGHGIRPLLLVGFVFLLPRMHLFRYYDDVLIIHNDKADFCGI